MSNPQPSSATLGSSSSTTSQAPIPYPTIQAWKAHCQSPISENDFLLKLPKIELHVHIEGTLSSHLRFKLAQKHGSLPIHSARLGKSFDNEEDLEREVYGGLLGVRSIKGKGVSAFFEAYYGGMEVLRDEEDFYDLCMSYYRRAYDTNTRYAEIMFDIQAHTRRGVSVSTVMAGLERAKIEAERDLDVKSNFTANFLRDLSLEDAIKHYELLIPSYNHLIKGIGLDSNEFDNPPSKFQALFARARKDGLKVTSHCDVAQPATLSNIDYVLKNLGSDQLEDHEKRESQGGDRIDHGLDAAQDAALVAEVARRKTGMTLCPWAYVRHHEEKKVFGWMRRSFDAGVLMNVSSDSPAYVEGNYLMENLRLLRLVGGWSEEEFVRVQRDSIVMCWADDDLKKKLRGEVDEFWMEWTDGGKKVQ